MLVQSKTNIGPVGEYIYDSSLMDIDTSIDSNQPPTRKRKNSFTVNEGLERLSKLRKLYLIDE